jgi:hypothetical protein
VKIDKVPKVAQASETIVGLQEKCRYEIGLQRSSTIFRVNSEEDRTSYLINSDGCSYPFNSNMGCEFNILLLAIGYILLNRFFVTHGSLFLLAENIFSEF